MTEWSQLVNTTTRGVSDLQDQIDVVKFMDNKFASVKGNKNKESPMQCLADLISAKYGADVRYTAMSEIMLAQGVYTQRHAWRSTPCVLTCP